jgi:hypothetical protein
MEHATVSQDARHYPINLHKTTNSMSFIPASYDVSSLSGGDQQYLKLKNGENKIRILSKELVFGYEYWTTENKPKRLKTRPSVTPSDIRLNEDGKTSPIRELWSMFVWDYSDSQVKIWNFYQMSLKKDLTALSNDEDWGHPNQYDIKITKTGSSLTTEYKIIASPKKDLTQSQLDAIEEKVLTFDLNSQFIDAQPLPQQATVTKNGSTPKVPVSRKDLTQWALSKGITEEMVNGLLEDINKVAQEKAEAGQPMTSEDKRKSFFDSVKAYLDANLSQVETDNPDDIPF